MVLLSACLVVAGCGDSDSASKNSDAGQASWKSAVLSGGGTTNLEGNQSSFGFDSPAPNLSEDSLAIHLGGDAQFERAFIKAPSNQFAASDGLGPAFNNNACISCHPRDGRANFNQEIQTSPAGTWHKLGPDAGVFLRISTEAGSACLPDAGNLFCAPVGVPQFSQQLFHRGVFGLRTDSPFSGQADVHIRFELLTVDYPDGAKTTLRLPVFDIRNPYDDPGARPGDASGNPSRLYQTDVRTSPRMAPAIFGAGLLEAIAESDILALADPDDLNSDGISGRANRVFDPLQALRNEPIEPALGRFGWKAGAPSVHVQSSGAYNQDMGVTNYVFPLESIAGTDLYTTYRQSNPDDDGQQDEGFEVSEQILKAVSFYASTLAVPGRRNVDDAIVRQGADLFETAGCAACHHPHFVTGEHPGIWGPGGLLSAPELSNQSIFPYTDLLLHDMGEALADGRAEHMAGGTEWRTPPLWGIGLVQTVNPLAGYLHDGRARTLEEAILWHGGEASTARNAFVQMPAQERNALLRFLGSL